MGACATTRRARAAVRSVARGSTAVCGVRSGPASLTVARRATPRCCGVRADVAGACVERAVVGRLERLSGAGSYAPRAPRAGGVSVWSEARRRSRGVGSRVVLAIVSYSGTHGRALTGRPDRASTPGLSSGYARGERRGPRLHTRLAARTAVRTARYACPRACCGEPASVSAAAGLRGRRRRRLADGGGSGEWVGGGSAAAAGRPRGRRRCVRRRVDGGDGDVDGGEGARGAPARGVVCVAPAGRAERGV